MPCRRSRSRRTKVELTVSSSGNIIPADVIATLFQPFRRGKARRKITKGVGLGLHIVDQIVRAHGGTIAVSSGEHTTQFVVTLPCDVPTG